MKKILFLIVAAIFCLPSESFAQYSPVFINVDEGYQAAGSERRDWNLMATSSIWKRSNLRNNHKSGGRIHLNPVEYIKPIEEVIDETTGTATLRWADGSSYVGETYRTTLHGTGTMTYPDNGKYYGQWKYSHRDGIGTMVYPDGSKYIGSWVRDVPNGQGTFINPEGVAFSCNFKNGVPHGKCIMQDLDGRKYTARWVRGKLRKRSIKPLEE